MTTTILHNNVIGTSYQHSRWDVSRMRATRKLIVKSDASSIEDVNHDATSASTVVGELTAVTGSAGSYETILGPLWVDPDGATQQNDWEIVHPDNNTLPLQTIDVSVMGDQRYLVTLQYFVTPGVQGGGAGTTVAVQFRAEMYARKSYYRAKEISANGEQETILVPDDFSVSSGGVEQFARTEMVPQVKIQIPFATLTSPVSNTTILKVGGLNSESVTIGDKKFNAFSVRFDGVQMDEFGTTTSSNSQTFKFKGFYEFTARGGLGFRETIFIPGEVEGDGTQKYDQVDVWENIQAYSSACWTLADLGIS